MLCASSGRRKIRLITRNRKAAPRFAAGLVRRVVRQVPPDGAGVSRGFPCELSGRWTAIGGREREAARTGQPKRRAGNHLPVPGGTVATTCVRGDNNTACGRKDPRRIFYQQRTGRKGHGSNSSQSEGPINIAARHTDVRWIAMPGPNGTMKPTKPNSNQTQTKTGTEQNCDRTEHPATPTRSFISRPRRNPFRKSATESSQWLCPRSSELNTSQRIVSNPARLSKPLSEFLPPESRLATYQASTRALESAVSRQVWPILRFPARIANFFSNRSPRIASTLSRPVHCTLHAKRAVSVAGRRSLHEFSPEFWAQGPSPSAQRGPSGLPPRFPPLSMAGKKSSATGQRPVFFSGPERFTGRYPPALI